MLQLEFSPQQKCIDLLRADTEDQVINLLRQYGYWDDPSVWRPFGGDIHGENNYSTIGNQAAKAEAALTEKLVNSVDAVLMGECWSSGIRPDSREAPRNIPEAVAKFFFGDVTRANTVGHISRWESQMRRRVSNRITLAATGSRQNTSLTVVDDGEGQTPESMPNTLLSLNKSNKINIQFVQGKFNTGGTAALRFCGSNNLQLIISRRNPNIKMVGVIDTSSRQWGFTIVRREVPTSADLRRSSTYKYLAPENNGVLRFDADEMPLFPQGSNAYIRKTQWGTAIKLYDYKLSGRSHILRGDGLLQRMDILLPKVALPIRFHECREEYEGKKGSYDTTLAGLSVHLSNYKSNNLEPGFPTSGTFTVSGQHMTYEVYAFKRDEDKRPKADSYRKREGVIFALNGQTQGTLDKRFFSRTAVGMNRLEDSILVIVDCSRFGVFERENLFMNSRDRMQEGELRRAIEKELELILKSNSLLRQLREQRQREDAESKLIDSKPLKDILESLFRKSRAIAALLAGEGPLTDPVKSRNNYKGNEFLGKPHPSFFRFRDKDDGYVLQRNTACNSRSRIMFETDVMNDYFTRAEYAGEHVLRSLHNGLVPDYNLNLESGIATLNLALPEGVRVGDSLEYELAVEDGILFQPFVNKFVVSVAPPQKQSGGKGTRKSRSNSGKGDQEIPKGLNVPVLIPVYEPDWGAHGFNKTSALKPVHAPSDEEGDTGSHIYYVNMDNIYLKAELAASKENPELLKAKWQYGMVLIAMALLRENNNPEISNSNTQDLGDGDEIPPQEKVSGITAAIAPVLLPLIEHLGALSDKDVAT